MMTIGTFLLEYAFMHPDLIPFVVSQLASLLAIMTLIGWFEVEKYKDVYKDISQFIQVNIIIVSYTPTMSSLILLYKIIGLSRSSYYWLTDIISTCTRHESS